MRPSVSPLSQSHSCRSTSGALFLSPYFIPSAAPGQEDDQVTKTSSLAGWQVVRCFVLSEDYLATGGSVLARIESSL